MIDYPILLYLGMDRGEYQADKIKNTNTYKQKSGIPAIIRDKIKPVSLDLSDDRLLSKCLHGKTQNNNEAINMETVPKRCFCRSTDIRITSIICSYILQ